jgi:hypothetical protein
MYSEIKADIKYMFGDFAISGILDTWQNDLITFVDYARGTHKVSKNQFQSDEEYAAHNTYYAKKVTLAALRSLATLGMAVGLAVAITSAVAIISSPVGALCGLGFGVAFYAANHDVFIVCKNISARRRDLNNRLNAILKSIWNDIKNFGSSELEPLSQGTVFKVIVDYAIKGNPNPQ